MEGCRLSTAMTMRLGLEGSFGGVGLVLAGGLVGIGLVWDDGLEDGGETFD